MKQFIIHAGTHKTATSYIQSRLRANVNRLQSMGVESLYPGAESRKHKPLAAALKRQRWAVWKRYLRQVSGADTVLISAEQFTQPISQPDCFEPLLEVLLAAGYQLRVVVFLRDQPDYINARYVHSTRRLYHCIPFDAYVRIQMRRRQHIFDYDYLFRHLLSSPGLAIEFLPYKVAAGDPYERLMDHLGFHAADGWLPGDRSRGNIQPGCRGVWLAQQIGQRLREQDLKPRQIKNSGAVVRRIAQREGWTLDRYFGFTPELAQQVIDHYGPANDRFASSVWGCSWRSLFDGVLPRRQVYELPSDGPERDQMLGHLETAMATIASHRFKP